LHLACLAAWHKQQGWLLWLVILNLLLITLGVLMLMSQAQLSLKGAGQEHRAAQETIHHWPALLNSRSYTDGQ
tara:strand:+ start:69 stop:287 length:219 start_codon:yes stop_codon:yes gene_type:complete